MSHCVDVLSLSYSTELLRTDEKPASDGAKRRLFYAERVESYTALSLTRKSEGFVERELGNLRTIPTNGHDILHALWRMYRLGSQVCSEGKINVIQAQEPNTTGLVGYLLKRIFKLPISICVYGPNPWDKHWRRASFFNSLTAPLARYILHHADGIVVDGSLTLERLQQAGIARERLTWKPMIPSNIAEFAKADGGPLRESLLGDDFQHLLLCVGNMDIQKNVPFVLRALEGIVRRVPKTRLVMVGRGRRKGRYVHLARRLRLEEHILWLDAVPHEEIPTYFRACDILLLGSRFEGFPRVLMEAAAAGRAIVTTEVSGSTDGVIPNESGFVVAQGDLEGFVAHVVELLQDPEKAAAMGQRGQPLMHDLALKRQWFNQRQVEVWEEILQASR